MTGRKWSLKRHINLPSVAEGLDFMAELLKPKKSRYSKVKDHIVIITHMVTSNSGKRSRTRSKSPKTR